MTTIIAAIFCLGLLASGSLFSVGAETQDPHPCRRSCKAGAEPMTCRYEFSLSMYASMGHACGECPLVREDCFNPGCISAEGKMKALYLINTQLPGPAIEVCQGDRIIVDLKNELATETTSIHWHGQDMKQAPHMDGVPFVTQCPIMPAHSFRYDFLPDRTGTYMWHSHSNDQRGEGVFGPLIVRAPPQADVHRDLYDSDEHVMVLSDWSHILSAAEFALTTQTKAVIRPHTLLVNGLGRYESFKDVDGSDVHTPTAVFEVEQGLRYRFRIINAGVQDCSMHLSFDNHTMLVISMDGSDVEPVEVDSVRLLSGERYDVIVTAAQKIDNFWIRVSGKEGSRSLCNTAKAHQVAVLRYKGAPDTEPTADVEFDIPIEENLRELNPYNQGTESSRSLCIASLNATDDDDETSQIKPDYQFYISYDYFDLEERNTTKNLRKRSLRPYEAPSIRKPKTLWQLNHINMKIPPFPLFSQTDMIEPGHFCNESTAQNCLKEYCSCTHVLEVKKDSVVELVIVDEGTIKVNHPLHLHGFHFRVVAMQQVNGSVTTEQIKQMDKEGKIPRKLNSAPLKDTVMIPNGGFTIIRFLADNPGYWLMHCHFELHAEIGMALLFKVGEHEDFVKPPANFPRCGTSF